MSKNPVVVDSSRLEACVAQFFGKHDVPKVDARLIANALVQTDLWGHQSHGVLRASWYIKRLRHSVMAPCTAVEVVRDRRCYTILDGKDGIGQVIAKQAMDLAIAKAREYGVGTVTVRHSNHFGTLMYYTRMAAQQGCVAFMTTNAAGRWRLGAAPGTRLSATTRGLSPLPVANIRR